MVEAAQSWPLRATRGLVSGARQRVDDSDSVWLCGESDRRHVSDLRLDLTHRPTRLEVMARLGARVGADVRDGVLWFRLFARYTWVIDGAAGASASWSPDGDGDASPVPALADLDPTDDTCLSDGAKRFDVRALAIVLRQVFGPRVTP